MGNFIAKLGKIVFLISFFNACEFYIEKLILNFKRQSISFAKLKNFNLQTAHKPREGQWSSWSRPSPPIPAPSLETPVRITSITKLGGTSTSLHFTWTVPPTDLLRCTAFRITVVPRDGREPARVFTVDGNTFQYQVDGLRPATIYAVTVEPIVNDQRHAVS